MQIFTRNYDARDSTSSLISDVQTFFFATIRGEIGEPRVVPLEQIRVRAI